MTLSFKNFLVSNLVLVCVQDDLPYVSIPKSNNLFFVIYGVLSASYPLIQTFFNICSHSTVIWVTRILCVSVSI